MAPLPARPGEASANRELWSRIAVPFSETRHTPWSSVVGFLHGFDQGARVVDLAGGNGRHALAAHRIGLSPHLVDLSGELVRLARQKASEEGFRLPVIEADTTALPFRDGAFDGAMFVAGVHCIRGRKERVQALAEMRRVVRKDGRALVTVWSAEQERFRDLVAAQRDAAEPGVEVGDVVVPWSRDVDAPVERFFHVYDEAGLRSELEEAGLDVERLEAISLTRSATPDNWFARVRC